MQALVTSTLDPGRPDGGLDSANWTATGAEAPTKGNSASAAQDGSDRSSNHQPSTSDNGMEGFQRLQRRMLLATLMATALAVPVTLLLFDRGTAASLLIGAFAGLLYLVLLARSVSRLGTSSKSLGKVQLLVPVALVLAAAKIPALQMLPALIGFLLYKPALIAQALLDF